MSSNMSSNMNSNMNSNIHMDNKTLNSGTRLFYQVLPSGETDPKNFIRLVPVQMVPGKSLQTLLSSPVRVVTSLAPQPKASVVSIINNKINATGNVPSVRQNHHDTTNAQVHLPLSGLPQNARTKPFLTTSRIKPSPSSTTTIIPGVHFISVPKPPPIVSPISIFHPTPPKAPNIHTQSNAKVLPKKSSNPSTVFFASRVTNKNPNASPTSSKANFFANPAHSTVVFVSPTQSQTIPLPEANTLKTSSDVTNNLVSDSSSNKPQTLIPHFSQRPNSPIKWVVEESECLPTSPSVPSQTPVISPTVASEVLDIVAKREQSNKKCEAATQAQDTDEETNEAEEKSRYTVVMCNDKIFFRVKKDVTEPTGHTKEQSELIDLCDDDDDVLEVTETGDVSRADEDNVQFVAYIPPETSSSSGKDTAEKSLQTLNVPEGMSDRKGARSKKQVGPGSSSHTDSAELVSSHRKRHKRRSHNMEISTSPSPVPYPVADRKLKRMFGITSEVRVRLYRIHLSSSNAGRSAVTHIPPLDYTEPIDEDFFLSASDSPHSQHCPEVKAGSSRVSRTRKRTKCPCCSPAALHRRHSQKRRSKPGDGERRETARKRLKLQPAPVTTATDGSFGIGSDRDFEELQISQQIQILREALRLKEAALEKLKSDKNG